MLWLRPAELSVITVERVERVEPFVMLFAVDELRPLTALSLNEVLLPVVFIDELRDETFLPDIVELRPLMDEDDAYVELRLLRPKAPVWRPP